MDDTEVKRREKERANRRFEREEMGELLRLFSALGLTVAAGIVGCFLAGLWVDRELVELGWRTRGLPRIAGVLLGLSLSLYWAYLRIVRHLRKFDPAVHQEKEKEDDKKRGDEDVCPGARR